MGVCVCVLYLHHTGLGRVLSVPPVTGCQAVLHAVCHYPEEEKRRKRRVRKEKREEKRWVVKR